MLKEFFKSQKEKGVVVINFAFLVALTFPASIYIYDFISREKQKIYLNDAAHIGIYEILSSKGTGSVEELVLNALTRYEQTLKSPQIEISNSGGTVTLKTSSKYNGIFLKSGFQSSNITPIKELSI